MRKLGILNGFLGLMIGIVGAGCGQQNDAHSYGKDAREPNTFARNVERGLELREIEKSQKLEKIECLREEIKKNYDLNILFGHPDYIVSEIPNYRQVDQGLYCLSDLESKLGEIYEGLRWETKTLYLGRSFTLVEYPKGFFSEAQGVAFHERPGECLVSLNNYNFGSVVHEMAHVKEIFAEERFHVRWTRGMDIHFVFYNGDATNHPENGHICGYGARGPCNFGMCNIPGMVRRMHEDIATYVAEIYEPAFGRYQEVDVRDERYIGHLLDLRDNGFISTQQLSGVLKVLGKRHVERKFEPFSDNYFQNLFNQMGN